MKTSKNVDSYIANSTDEARAIMEKLREIIKSTVPGAEEGISWNVPIYKFHGVLAGYSISKKHVSLGVDILTEKNRETLKEKNYKTGKKTIQIQFGQEVPAMLIKKILKEQAEANKMANDKK